MSKRPVRQRVIRYRPGQLEDVTIEEEYESYTPRRRSGWDGLSQQERMSRRDAYHSEKRARREYEREQQRRR